MIPKAWETTIPSHFCHIVQIVHTGAFEWNVRSCGNQQEAGRLWRALLYSWLHSPPQPAAGKKVVRTPSSSMSRACWLAWSIWIGGSTAVINALHEAGVHLSYADIIKLINKWRRNDLRLVDDVCHVEINRIVRKGDTISVMLFAATMEGAFR